MTYEERSKSNKPASKRPIERSDEFLDVEPIRQDKLTGDNQPSNSAEIEDPW